MRKRIELPAIPIMPLTASKAILAAVCVLLYLACASPASAQWSNGYTYRRTITIDHTKVPNTDQSNFPVLISGTYSYLATTGNGGNVTNSNGYDIIFISDSGGSSILAFEQESYSASTGAVNYWVKVATVSHTTDTVIYLFYGNSSVTTDQSNKTGVYDSNYKAVYHLPNGTSLSGSDSTSNGYNLTNNNSTAATTGKIGGAGSFNGTNNYLSNSSLSISAGSSITISFWNYVSTVGTSPSAFSIGNSNFPNRIQAHAPWGSNTLYWDYGNIRSTISYTSYLSSWTYVVLEYNSSNSTQYVYLNGSLATSNTDSTPPASTQTGIAVGAWTGNSLYHKGNLDEFRVSTSVRSADWTATEYNNQGSPSTFYSVGSSLTAPHITSLSTTSGAVGDSITITGTAFGSTQGSSTVTFNGTSATPTSWSATRIAAPVPSGATTGNVVVTVSGVASNSVSFTVVNPTITSLSRTWGEVDIEVTITGTSFGSTQGSSTVQFNGTTATPTSWSATSIATTVPSGATTGNVVITVSSVNSNGVSFTVSSGGGSDSSGIYYYFSDQLGTARVITDASGTVCYDGDMYPYGGERAYTDLCDSNYKFDGKERDAESGLDNFGARYYSSQYGRFMIPDWAAKATAVPYADFGNPQTLNLYAMVHDNPESLADLDGHECVGVQPGCLNAKGSNETQSGNPDKAQKPMSLSSKGLDFIKRHEGYSDKVYNDVAGNATIGYGHLIKEGENFDKGITEGQASDLLKQDTKVAVDAVNATVEGSLSQNKFDALVDFTYNLGARNLDRSTLASNINAGNDVTMQNFTDWNRAGGKVVPGLTVRRTDEYNLFSNGNYGGQ